MAMDQSVSNMDGKHMNGVELRAMDAKQNNDDEDMARLGKNPVLKVWSLASFFPLRILMLTLVAAQFWVHVHIGLQLYGRYHMGSFLDVRNLSKASSPYRSANLAKSLRARLRKVGIPDHLQTFRVLTEAAAAVQRASFTATSLSGLGRSQFS
jgi:hypothetical protein